MANSREEEYLRRMKARGYEPSLAGMDDDDIEWELDKMDGKNPLQEARPAERPLFPGYKPPDPAMVARIYRQMGRPYDASLIPEKEKYYLNGWDNDDDDDIDDPRKKLRPMQKWPPAEPFDPFKNVWKLDWGPEGSPAERARTLEYRPERDGTRGYGAEKNVLMYGPGNFGNVSNVQEMSHNLSGGYGEGTVTKAGGWDKAIGVAGEIIKSGIDVQQFAEEIEKEALRNGDNAALAGMKAQEAASMYQQYLAIAGGATGWASSKGGYPVGVGVGTAGAAFGTYAVKPWIKDQVMGRTEDDYNRKDEPPKRGGD